jgi:hypothetical protein
VSPLPKWFKRAERDSREAERLEALHRRERTAPAVLHLVPNGPRVLAVKYLAELDDHGHPNPTQVARLAAKRFAGLARIYLEPCADFDLARPAWWVVADDGVEDDVLGVLRLQRAVARMPAPERGHVAPAHGRAPAPVLRVPTDRSGHTGLEHAQVWRYDPTRDRFIHPDYPGVYRTESEVARSGDLAYRPMSAWGTPYREDSER